MRMMLTDITNQFVLPLWNEQALEVVDCYVAPSADIQTTFLSGQGPQALKDYVRQIFSVFSAFEFSIEEILELDNQLIYKWRGHGIHCGQVLNMSANGRKIVFSGIISVEILEGEITRYHSFSDIPRVINDANELSITERYPHIFDFNKEEVIMTLKHMTGRRLTNREVECLSLWMKGFAIKDAAKLMGGLSCRTIQTFRENIKRKLNVDSYQQLFGLVQESGKMPMLLN